MRIELGRWAEVAEALRHHLASGGVAAIPTESSYALAADPRRREGVDRIYALKRRAAAMPLPVVMAGVEQLPDLSIDTGQPGLSHVARHWPAALSIVADTAKPLPAGGGDRTLAVRIPDLAPLRELLARTGPLTATSANRSGEAPVLDPLHLHEVLAGSDAWIVDGGVLAGGPPSTLVRWRGGCFELLREGKFPYSRLQPESSTA